MSKLKPPLVIQVYTAPLKVLPARTSWNTTKEASSDTTMPEDRHRMGAAAADPAPEQAGDDGADQRRERDDEVEGFHAFDVKGTSRMQRHGGPGKGAIETGCSLFTASFLHALTHSTTLSTDPGHPH